jgi:hypothetical protein
MNDIYDDAKKDKEEPGQVDEVKPIEWREFLESYPVGISQIVKNYYGERNGYAGDSSPYFRVAPRLRLYCDTCEGYRNFDGQWRFHEHFGGRDLVEDFIDYKCRDCSKGKKTFCISSYAEEGLKGHALKIAEYPDQYIEIPTSLRKLLDSDFSLFSKGLKCEKFGLGIGAFTYYRRVVENQKAHLIGEILKVARKFNSPEDVITQLEDAHEEQQFARAVEKVGKAIPESLLVDSHNPLKLLYKSLSTGVHYDTDEKCLRIAHSIRLVLVDLAERIALALKEQNELHSAISELFKLNTEADKEKKPQ